MASVGPPAPLLRHSAVFHFVGLPFHLDILTGPVHLLGLSTCFYVWHWGGARAESGRPGQSSIVLSRPMLRRRGVVGGLLSLFSRAHPARRGVSFHRDDAPGAASLPGSPVRRGRKPHRRFQILELAARDLVV